VQWSHDLLDDDERTLLRRLSVFAGGFDPDAVLAVGGPGSLDALSRLVERSLVQLDDPGEGRAARYRLLETIRDFAGERLAAAGEADAVGDRHLAWAAGLAAELEEGTTAAHAGPLAALERELANLRAALAHAGRADADAEEGLRLAASLALFWSQRGYATEGADRAELVLAAHPDAPARLRGRARWAVAYDRFYTFDFAPSVAAATAALEEARAAGDKGTEARCRHTLGANEVMVDPDASRSHFAAAVELARAAGDRWCESDALQFLGWGPLIQHRPNEVGTALAESGAMAAAAGNRFQLGWHHLGLAALAAAAGDLAQAVGEAMAGTALGRELGDPAVETWGLANLAVLALLRGEPAALAEIVAAIDRPGRPLGAVGDVLAAAFRTAADPATDAGAVADALVSAAAVLVEGNDPPDGLRLLLLAATARWAADGPSASATAVEQALAACAGYRSALAGSCRVLQGRLLRADGDRTAAERAVHDGLAELVEAQLWLDVPDALEVLGGLAVDADGYAEGLRLLAAAEALDARAGRHRPFAALARADAERAVAALGDGAAQVRAEGAALDAPTAVGYARRARGERRRPSFGWESLTPTELQVVQLAAQGLSNAAIAERLFVARGTVKTHLEHVYAKLGLRGRTELAAAVVRRGL
jgi:DNA-binding CsgD family transcriptional regulator